MYLETPFLAKAVKIYRELEDKAMEGAADSDHCRFLWGHFET